MNPRTWKLTKRKSECRDTVEPDSASRRPVEPSLHERCDRTTRTLDCHWDLHVITVQYGRVGQSLVVDGIARQRDHSVTTHRAVSLVVHEDGGQISVTCRRQSRQVAQLSLTDHVQ